MTERPFRYDASRRDGAARVAAAGPEGGVRDLTAFPPTGRGPLRTRPAGLCGRARRRRGAGPQCRRKKFSLLPSRSRK